VLVDDDIAPRRSRIASESVVRSGRPKAAPMSA
jgi:hypothetical protein